MIKLLLKSSRKIIINLIIFSIEAAISDTTAIEQDIMIKNKSNKSGRRFIKKLQ